MRTEIVKVELTEDQLKSEASKLSIAEQELFAAENRLDAAGKAWKAKRETLVNEVDLCRESVHDHATMYRTGTRDEEVEVDERVKNGVIEVFRVDTRETIRTKPIETGDQLPIEGAADDADETDVPIEEGM